MRITALFAAALYLIASTASAQVMKITEDRGGQIGHYLQTFAAVRSSGEPVMVDGNCLSACTLVLGLIPRNRICATDRARFGFHAAWMPGDDGSPVTSPLGTQALWKIYPGDVRHWINRHGGLTRRMIYLQGPAVYQYVHSCTNPAATRTVHAKSRRHLARFANARAR